MMKPSCRACAKKGECDKADAEPLYSCFVPTDEQLMRYEMARDAHDDAEAGK